MTPPLGGPAPGPSPAAPLKNRHKALIVSGWSAAVVFFVLFIAFLVLYLT